jgi:hypothetical protein
MNQRAGVVVEATLLSAASRVCLESSPLQPEFSNAGLVEAKVMADLVSDRLGDLSL